MDQLSDEQRLIRDQAQRLLQQHGAAEVTRRLLDVQGEFDRALWRKAIELGWTALPIPEAAGGLGLSPVETCLIAEQLGAAPASIPFLASTVLATQLLLDHADAAQRARWLPQLAEGQCIACVGFSDGAGADPLAALSLRWQDGRLGGALSPVLAAAHADLLIAPAQTAAGVRLVAVDLHAAGVERTVQSSFDNGRGYARVELRQAAAELLGASSDGQREMRDALDRGAIAAAFEALGGADACLAMAREYALTRKAFGQPIGAFQAIKHRLADAYALIEVARGNTLFALWRWSSGGALPQAACAARLSAIKAYEFIARENIQIHGGFGVSWEAQCHLHYRRSRALALDLGSAPYWRDRLLDHLAAA